MVSASKVLLWMFLRERILLMLSPEVLAHLPNGAYMIISGIIAEREEEVLSAYKALGLTDLLGIEMGDWRAHLLRR